jgi:two-component system NarL family response regulator
MRIVIADDEEMFRHAMKFICAGEFGHDVVGAASDGEEAAAMAKAERPDVLLIELGLTTLDGFGVIRTVRPHCPLTSIIAVSAHLGSYTLFRVERAGFDGFIDKGPTSISSLRRALAAAAQGQKFFSPAFGAVREARLRDPGSFDKVLSDRELEVFSLIGQSMSDDEIGEQLRISARTAETFRHRILKKLGVAGTPKLIRLAIELGFAQIPARLPGSRGANRPPRR